MSVYQNEPIRFKCLECDYKTGNAMYLRDHMFCMHIYKDKRFQCPKCEYKAKHKKNLKEHNELVHEAVLYPCSQCNFWTKRQSILKRHIRTKH